MGLNLINLTDRVLGPFQVWVSEGGSPDEKAVVVNGLQTMVTYPKYTLITTFTRYMSFDGEPETYIKLSMLHL